MMSRRPSCEGSATHHRVLEDRSASACRSGRSSRFDSEARSTTCRPARRSRTRPAGRIDQPAGSIARSWSSRSPTHRPARASPTGADVERPRRRPRLHQLPTTRLKRPLRSSGSVWSGLEIVDSQWFGGWLLERPAPWSRVSHGPRRRFLAVDRAGAVDAGDHARPAHERDERRLFARDSRSRCRSRAAGPGIGQPFGRQGSQARVCRLRNRLQPPLASRLPVEAGGSRLEQAPGVGVFAGCG